MRLPETDTQPLTVAELVKLLQRCNPDAKVEMEGCDCTGLCFSVSGVEDPAATTVLLMRE
jgi:hypothetical protein